MDFKELHKRLQCGTCYWADQEAVGEGPCCTKPQRPTLPNQDGGKCGDWRDRDVLHLSGDLMVVLDTCNTCGKVDCICE